MGMTTTTKGRKAPRKSPEQREADLKAAHDMIVAEVEKITNDDEWRRWLNVMSRMHKYSFGNIILAHVQCAQRGMSAPTMLAGYGKWQEIGRQVRKGERGLKIYAPLMVKIKEGEPGYVPGENRTKLVGFKIVSTFDVQQTDGDEIPKPKTGLDIVGDAPEGLYDALAKIAADNGYSVRSGNTKPAEGHTDPLRREIVIDNAHDVPDAMGRAVAILAHEVAHMLLHVTTEEGNEYDYRAHRGVAETEAESIAYLVGTYYGIDMQDSSFHYVAGWAKDPELVQKVGQRVQRTAAKIIDQVDKILS